MVLGQLGFNIKGRPCKELFVKSFQCFILIFFLGSLCVADQALLRKLNKACKAQDQSACNQIFMIQRRQAQKETSVQDSVQNRIKCNKNDAEACFDEAFDEDALGNLKLANTFYEKACELKLARGCSNRAFRANEAKQNEISEKYYTKACDLNDMKACNVLAMSKIEKDDLYEAYNLYKKACDAKFYLACYNMGWVQAQWQNYKLADQYYQMACKEKIVKACENRETIRPRLLSELGRSEEKIKIQDNFSNLDVACEKVLKFDYLSVIPDKPSGVISYDAVNSYLTKANYRLFNRKKECGAKNIRLPASHRLPYTGLEVKD